MNGHRRPVRRVRVLMGAVGLFALLGSVVVIGQVLRHPVVPTGVAEEEFTASDPRDELDCPAPRPREGQQRTPDSEIAPILNVASGDLYDCPEFYDGQRVRYRGEVVGALLHRDNGVWVQLNDDAYAELIGPLPAHRNYRGGNAGVGVLMPTQLTEQIEFVGGPQVRGDIVEVGGTFNRIDPTGEVAVIRADTAELVTEGGPFADPLLRDRQFAAVLAVVLVTALVVAERVVARRR